MPSISRNLVRQPPSLTQSRKRQIRARASFRFIFMFLLFSAVFLFYLVDFYRRVFFSSLCLNYCVYTLIFCLPSPHSVTPPFIFVVISSEVGTENETHTRWYLFFTSFAPLYQTPIPTRPHAIDRLMRWAFRFPVCRGGGRRFGGIKNTRS